MVNKPDKCFISKKYNQWLSVQVANQLNEGKNPGCWCNTEAIRSQVTTPHVDRADVQASENTE